MQFEVTTLVNLRAAASMTASILGQLFTGQRVTRLSGDDGDEWWQVRVDTDPMRDQEGWMKSEFLRLIQPAIFSIDLKSFAENVTIAASIARVNRDLLLYIAWIESKFENKRADNSSCFGPFQFLPETWNAMVKKYGEETGIDEDDILDPDKQPYFAARLMAENTAYLSKKLGRLPNGLEIYLAHLLGAPAAKEIALAAPNAPVDQAMTAAYGDAGKAKRYIDANPGILKTNGQTSTNEEVLNKIERRLQSAFEPAAKLIALLGEAPANTLAAGDPPWLAVALAEEQAGVTELVGGKPNPRLADYFKAVGHDAHGQVEAWCAAFVGFCLQETGRPEITRKIRKSAHAADWVDVGRGLAIPKRGAIALTPPFTQTTSGHLGFVIEIDADRILLLGGNQNDAVGKKWFKKHDGITYRWIDYDIQ